MIEGYNCFPKLYKIYEDPVDKITVETYCDLYNFSNPYVGLTGYVESEDKNYILNSSFLWEEITTPTDPLLIPYVTFRAEQASSTLGLVNKFIDHTLEYSTDKLTWNTLNTSTTVSLANINDEVYVRGIWLDTRINWSQNGSTQFKMTGQFKVEGNAKALWDYTNLKAPLAKGCGMDLFRACRALRHAGDLLLPDTTLSDHCYQNMFDSCSTLESAPKLFATYLSKEAYTGMFNNGGGAKMKEIYILANGMVSGGQSLYAWNSGLPNSNFTCYKYYGSLWIRTYGKAAWNYVDYGIVE